MSKYGHFGPSEVDKNVKLDLDEIFRTGVGDIGIFLHCYYELEFTIGQMFADSDQSCYPNASFSVLQFVAQLRLIKNWCGQVAIPGCRLWFGQQSWHRSLVRV